MPTFGIEEEVFVCEPERPSLASLEYLARLTWRDPWRHYTRTASNFARGADLRHGLMGCVEISTGVHADTDSLLADLAHRRRELALAVGVDGLIVPLGHLLQIEAPTNTAALQFHVGDVDRERAYANLAHFLPVLALLSADSPAAGGKRVGHSFRMVRGHAVGPLREDPRYRFQDLIVSKRLGTVEVRVLDPSWDPHRIRVLAEAIAAIASLDRAIPLDREGYNALRERVALEGYVDELRPLRAELAEICEVPEHLLERTAADEVWHHYATHGLVATYAALDNGWRHGRFEVHQPSPMGPMAVRSLLGLAGYYVPKAPYATWKYLRER